MTFPQTRGLKTLHALLGATLWVGSACTPAPQNDTAPEQTSPPTPSDPESSETQPPTQGTTAQETATEDPVIAESETEETEEAEETEAEPILPLRDHILPGEAQLSHDTLTRQLLTMGPRDFRPIGHTSVAFRMRTNGEHTVAYRPRTREHRRGHLAEVGAYAIGRLLDLDNVVPAVLRSLPRRVIADRLLPRYASEWPELEDRIFYRSPFATPGAAIYWVVGLRESDLDRGPARRAWSEWLAGGDIPEGKEALARDLSNMRVFDYLIANWDRFSGGNLKLFGGDAERVALRDHNIAFGRLSDNRHQQLRSAIRQTRRFSRQTVARLEQLDDAALLGALEEVNAAEERESLEVPILSEEERAGALERAQVVLSHVGAMIEAYGEEAVLYFD